MTKDEIQVNDERPDGQEVKKVDLDTILVEEIGEFGWFQVRMLCLTVLVVIFASWASVEYIFTTARITTRCFIPECESPTTHEFRPDWILNALPQSGSSFDQCSRFANASTLRSNTCPREWFDNTTVVPCESFVYENTHTVVYDYELACDEWRRSLIGSVRTMGVLLAMPITGFISDHWGRRVALCINIFNTAWLGIVRYWADTYVGFIVSEVVEAVFGSGGFSCAYILLMELMGPKYRVVAGAAMTTSFSVGKITLGLLAWAVPNWRNLTLTLYIPQLITIFYFFFISESVRWYMSKGHYNKSETVLKNVARMNGKVLSDNSLKLLRQNAEKEKMKKSLEEQEKAVEPWLIVLVFRHKAILARVLTSPVWWISATFINYGMSVSSVNMLGHRYLNFVAVSIVEIPGDWTAVFLMGKIGRKPVLIGAFWVCAACQVAYIFVSDENYVVSLTVYLIGKYSISIVMNTLYVYTNELYPTKHRHSLFAFSSMVGRIGSITAPLTPAIGHAVWEGLPFALFGAFALLSGFLVLITPETIGTELPDTMEEAASLKKKKLDS